MTPTTSQNNNHDGLWFCITVTIMCICIAFSSRCHAAEKETAQLDTIPCNLDYIENILVKKSVSAKGNETIKYIVIYKDVRNGIEDAIPMSKSVYEYVQECREVGITPILGIKLKNREINSIVRIRKKYVRK